jgi:hypothetical protein
MLTAIWIFGAIALTGIYVLGLRTIALNIRDVEMVLVRLLDIERRMTTHDVSTDVPSSVARATPPKTTSSS